MNWLDIVLGLIVVFSTLSGLRSGLVHVLIGLASTVLAFVLAGQFYGPAGALFTGVFSSAQAVHLAGFIVVFVVVLIAGAIVGRLIRTLLKIIGLSFLDRLAGGAFGVARAALIGAILVLALLAFSPTGPPDAVVNSMLAPYVVDAAAVLAGLAPKELRHGVDDRCEEAKQVWKKRV